MSVSMRGDMDDQLRLRCVGGLVDYYDGSSSLGHRCDNDFFKDSDPRVIDPVQD